MADDQVPINTDETPVATEEAQQEPVVIPDTPVAPPFELPESTFPPDPPPAASPTTDECALTGLRYNPLHTYRLLYQPENFAVCDRVSGRMAFAFTDKDFGVIELGHLNDGVDFQGEKRFYIDYKLWKDPNGLDIRAVGMSFGYDFQRIYVLYKQSLKDGTYKLWLTRYETGNYKDGDLVRPPISIPLYTLVHSRGLRGHPCLPGRTYPHDHMHVDKDIPEDGWDYRFGKRGYVKCGSDVWLEIGPWLNGESWPCPSGYNKDTCWWMPQYLRDRDKWERREEAEPASIASSVLEYLEAYGVAGVCLDNPALHPLFSCLVVHDKVLITMPVLFKPDRLDSPWKDMFDIDWTPEHPRVIYQLMIMLDETTSQIEACVILGAISWWLEEDKHTPWPEIWPIMPMKLRITMIDDCVVWQCSHARKFPPSLTDEEWYENPFVDYDPNAWQAADLVDRFWQPYQTEYVGTLDLINELKALGTTVMRPLRYPVQRVHAWTPIVTDLYSRVLVDWSGQRVYGLRGKDLIEYEVLYHNYKRKIIRGVKVNEYIEYWSEPVSMSFPAGTAGQALALKPGSYAVVADGAAGGNSTFSHKDTAKGIDVSWSNTGGKGARASTEFVLKEETNFYVYVGMYGAGYGSGRGGTYGFSEEIVDDIPAIDAYTKNVYPEDPRDNTGDAEMKNSGIRTVAVIPAGYKNVKLWIDGFGFGDTINVFTTGGKHLIGGPIGTARWEKANNYNWEPGDPLVVDTNYMNTKVLTTSNSFDSGARYDGSTVNGSGGFIQAGAYSITSPQVFPMNGMNIGYSGDPSMGAVENIVVGNQYISQQYLEIPVVTENLVLQVIGWGQFNIRAAWEAPPPNPPVNIDINASSGSGGGLTALVYNIDAPGAEILVAGSGGGAGAGDGQDMGGGGDGGVDGLPGTNVPGGSTTNGGLMRHGQSAPYNSTAGGGGAGYYGGSAEQRSAPSTLNSGGGGGGSSFVNGQFGYPLRVPDFELLSGAVQESVSAGGGMMKIVGNELHEKRTYVPSFKYEDHHLGEFYYQCTGSFSMSEQMTVIKPPPIPPMPASVGTITLPLAPICAPIPPVPLPVPPLITIDYPPPPPPNDEKVIDIVFLLDVTGSMPGKLVHMADNMINFVDKMTDRGFRDVHYFAMCYDNDEYFMYSPVTGTDALIGKSSPPYMMTTADQVSDAIRTLIYGKWPGGKEAGCTALVKTREEIGPELRHGSIVGDTDLGYTDTFYVLITDESNNYTGHKETVDKQKAIDVCKEDKAAMMWITKFPSGTFGSGAAGLILETADKTGGKVLNILTTDDTWGAVAADELSEAIATTGPVIPPLDPDQIYKVEDWAKTVPALPPEFNMNLVMPPMPEVPMPDAPTPMNALTFPEYSGWHTFSIENLACNTWMVNVNLRVTRDGILIGTPFKYSDNAETPIPRPDQTEMHWDEIPPAHEVLFSVMANTFAGIAYDGLELTYDLEMR